MIKFQILTKPKIANKHGYVEKLQRKQAGVLRS